MFKVYPVIASRLQSCALVGRGNQNNTTLSSLRESAELGSLGGTMREVIFTLNDLQVTRDGDRFFVRYDAGAHQVVMREDEINEADARRIQSGKDEMTEALRSLQKKLIARGVDPYVSNC